MVRFKDLDSPKLFRLITVYFIKIYLLLSLKCKIVQNSILPKGYKIFAINHPTTLDPFIIYSLFPNAKVLIDVKIFDIKILGWVFNKLKHIPVDINNGQLAYQDAKSILKKGGDLIIFPEGIRDHYVQGNVTDLKSGITRLALETNSTIVPIGIKLNPKSIKKIESRKTKSTTRLYFFDKYTINIGKSIKLRGDIKNREYVKRKTRYLKEEIQKLSRK
jgi:1-acyl-sn-glycerol-3-phosphate acyltransferase